MRDLLGSYFFKSQYFGDVPFEIYGIRDWDKDFPLEVRTFEFKGKRKIPVDTRYKEDVIRNFIAQGKLIRTTKSTPSHYSVLQSKTTGL